MSGAEGHNENSKSNLPAWKSGLLRCWLEAASLLWGSLRLNFEYFFQPTDNRMLHPASRQHQRLMHSLLSSRAGKLWEFRPGAGRIFFCILRREYCFPKYSNRQKHRQLYSSRVCYATGRRNPACRYKICATHSGSNARVPFHVVRRVYG